MMSAIAMAGIMGMTSCTDYLNKAPESDYQDNDPYKNFMNFQGFTEELYNCCLLYTSDAADVSWARRCV